MSSKTSTLVCCLALGSALPASVHAAQFACVETAAGPSPRTLSVSVDADAESVSVPTSEGPATGILQTTLDLYAARLETSRGRVYRLSLHRYTGRVSLTLEAATEPEDRALEFTGTCTPQ
jgi:hypothetical protein